MNAKVVREQVERIVTPVLEREGIELVDVTFRMEGRRWVVGVFIDMPDGVTLDDCAAVSHRIGDMIDVEDIIPVRYNLEVSSPGLDRVLKKEAHFRRFAGKWANIRLRCAREGRRNYKGRIVGCEEGVLDVEGSDGGRFRFSLGEIETARLDIEGNL